MKKSFLPLLFTFFCISNVVMAQVPDFQLLDANSGNNIKLSSYEGKSAVVLIFTSNYCPYSKLYEDRIKALYDEFDSQNVQFILINPNDPDTNPDESISEMKKRAGEKGFNFPYLVDKSREAVQIFDASKTPEVFVLKHTQTGFNIVYQGAIDNNPQLPDQVTSAYLKNALVSVLAGRNANPRSTRPTGCVIR
ncbi:thioredoxin family protein [Penaeicola halotolerans]|uniref:thioredoxin family protein n=1 Tax=Penaeicola halotolerans TaxID=2793196 RepID=UPI001CF900FF|nr:thioredoxin family protein [Penaeicola halotolerans]